MSRMQRGERSEERHAAERMEAGAPAACLVATRQTLE